MKGNFYLLLSVCVFFACSTNDPIEVRDDMVSISLLDVEERSNSYNIKKIVPLETTPNNLMGMHLRIRQEEGELFIFDEDMEDAIHRFDASGKYKEAVVLSGEGPDKVNNIYDFLVDGDTLEVLIGRGDHSVVVKVSLSTGTVLESPLGLLADSFEKLENGNRIFYTGYNLPIAVYRLIEIGPNGEEANTYLKNEYTNQMLPVLERNFQSRDGKVYFKEAFNSTVYSIESGGLQPRFDFDFGKYQIPSRFWEVDIMEGFNLINSSGFADIYQYMENENHAVFEIYIQDSTGVQNHQVLLDKRDHSISRRVFSNDENSIFYQLVNLDSDDGLIFVTPASFLKNHAEKHVLDKDLQALVDQIDKDDNPVLIYCSMD